MLRLVFVFILVSLYSLQAASAQIEDLPDYQFRDLSNDGNVWLDVDAFWGSSYETIVSTLKGTEFRIATKAEVEALFANEPLTTVGELGDKIGGVFKPTLCCRAIRGVYDDSLSGVDSTKVGSASIGDSPLIPASLTLTDDAIDRFQSSLTTGAWITRVEPSDPELRTRSGSDLDNDGIDEKVVWRNWSGTWYIRLSATNEIIVQQWGLPGDKPIFGDFDGDLLPDLAIWRPSTGFWFIKRSSRGFSVRAAVQQQFGLPGDHPMRGDFDGDGKLDIAVWRPSNGTFYYISSKTSAIFAEQWGLPGDIPLPSALIN